MSRAAVAILNTSKQIAEFQAGGCRTGAAPRDAAELRQAGAGSGALPVPPGGQQAAALGARPGCGTAPRRQPQPIPARGNGVHLPAAEKHTATGQRGKNISCRMLEASGWLSHLVQITVILCK